MRHLTEIRLWEASLVTFPANDLAMVTDIKGAAQDELAQLYALLHAQPPSRTRSPTEIKDLKDWIALERIRLLLHAAQRS